MIAALQSSTGAVLRTLDDAPVTTTAWMTASPVPTVTEVERLELAPGIWLIREKQWWPVSILDTAVELPYDDDVEPVRRKFPFPAWHEAASCNGVADADKFYFGVDDIGRPALPPRYFRAARAICATCPVTRDCLTQALGHPEQFGIWAGTTGRQRVPLMARVKGGESVESVVDSWLSRSRP